MNLGFIQHFQRELMRNYDKGIYERLKTQLSY